LTPNQKTKKKLRTANHSLVSQFVKATEISPAVRYKCISPLLYPQTTMKLFSNKVLAGGINAIERVAKNNAVAIAFRSAGVISKRTVSSMSEASYYTESEMDTHQFGYRFVSPVTPRSYTTTMSFSATETNNHREDYDEYDQIMMCPTTLGMNHTLGAIEPTIFPSLVPPGAVARTEGVDDADLALE
jgi:hypothetical protein